MNLCHLWPDLEKIRRAAFRGTGVFWYHVGAYMRSPWNPRDIAALCSVEGFKVGPQLGPRYVVSLSDRRCNIFQVMTKKKWWKFGDDCFDHEIKKERKHTLNVYQNQMPRWLWNMDAKLIRICIETSRYVILVQVFSYSTSLLSNTFWKSFSILIFLYIMKTLHANI